MIRCLRALLILTIAAARRRLRCRRRAAFAAPAAVVKVVPVAGDVVAAPLDVTADVID